MGQPSPFFVSDALVPIDGIRLDDDLFTPCCGITSSISRMSSSSSGIGCARSG